ncbi:MAG: ABC transporter permease [Spirochaetia bacterium]
MGSTKFITGKDGFIKNKLHRKLTLINRHKSLYLLLIPGIAFFVIFKYMPIYGIQLAFRDYQLYTPYHKMPWIGLEKFVQLLKAQEFWRAFRNTILISVYQIIFAFPVPIILAIIFSELRSRRLMRVTQTILTFPHFLSWVILSGIFFNLLANTGVINNFFTIIGLPKVDFLMNQKTFRGLLISSNIWKEAGWSSIIYMAAIVGIDTSLYEAAEIDGASRLQRIVHVTLPSIMGIVVVMLILQIGRIVNFNFLQVFQLYSPPVYEVGDVIETYVYRITFTRPPDFSFSTAVGLFKGVLNMILLIGANQLAKRLGYRGIF